MNAIRHTIWPEPTSPMTAIAQEEDFVNTVDPATELALPGIFSVTEVFEVPDGGGLTEAIAIACERAQERAECEMNMAVGYYWNADKLAITRAGGSLTNPSPAPYSVVDMESVLTQLAQHPNYKPGVTVRAVAEDGSVVVMKDGTTMVEGEL